MRKVECQLTRAKSVAILLRTGLAVAVLGLNFVLPLQEGVKCQHEATKC